jgi:translation initiation factor 1
MSKKKPPIDAPAGPFNNAFGGLGALKGSLPSAPEKPAAAPVEKKGPARGVVRLERAGRGGKEVTLVEHLELGASELEKWLKELKGAMGSGGQIEGDSIVLQGDQRERVAKWLEKKGVRKVTVAN